MYVEKKNKKLEPLSREKIYSRLARVSNNLFHVNIDTICDKVVDGLYDNVPTKKIDELLCETAAYMAVQHPEYSILAGRLAISELHKNTSSSFSETIEKLYNYIHPITKERANLIADDVYEIIKKNSKLFDNAIVHSRDYNFDYFGFKTLERAYLLKVNNEIVERPQYLFMRVSIGIHKNDLESALNTYNLMSEGWFIHATPTLFNSGTPKPQCSSCFLITMKEDSIEGIYETLKICALISKNAGGIGLSVHTIRAAKSYIKGTNGTSNGLVPMLRVFNDTARYVDQGGGKRKGAFAIYLEPWHSDIFEFLNLKKNIGPEEVRARDLFYALWIPDLFMKKVQSNEMWCLFCPNEAPGLADVWGDEFEKLYNKYEKEKRYKRKVKAQELWFAIIESQTETGTPYIMFKDACNSKSNQQNLGTIRSSNLCTEIVQYTSKDEVAVCNLASIALPKFVINGKFDHQKLFEIVQVVTKNLNKIIDINYYPVEEAKRSNLKHRPIGIGVQGLADTFFKLRLPFESKEAMKLNIEIFETIYFAALTASKDLAKIEGPYSTFQGSPLSKGKFSFDLWKVKPTSNRWNWNLLRQEILKYGVRNSLLVAPMPTASTSQILGNTECFEPITSNIYSRRVLSGEFVIINRYLVDDLVKLNLWTPEMINKLMAYNGSIQNIKEIPDNIKEIYKTVWEIKQRSLIDMAADRAPYIDQSQSFSVYIDKPSVAKLTSLHFYTWRKGLKTGMYYLRQKPATEAIQFTVDKQQLSSPVKSSPKRVQSKRRLPKCNLEEGCTMCSA